MMIAVACGLLALSILAYMFYVPMEGGSGPVKTRLIYLKERKDVVYENLRDLKFEYKAGKLSEADYQSMRVAMEDEAATLLSEIERLEAPPPRPHLPPTPRKSRKGVRF